MHILEEEDTIRLYAAKVQMHHMIMKKKLGDKVKNVAIRYSDGLVVVFNRHTSKIYQAWHFEGTSTQEFRGDPRPNAEIIHTFFNLETLGKIHEVPVLCLDVIDEDYID